MTTLLANAIALAVLLACHLAIALCLRHVWRYHTKRPSWPHNTQK